MTKPNISNKTKNILEKSHHTWTLGGDATVLDDYGLTMTTIQMDVKHQIECGTKAKRFAREARWATVHQSVVQVHDSR